MKKFVFVSLLLALAPFQQAAAKEGLYLNFSGQVDMYQDLSASLSGTPVDISFDTAFSAGAAVGYAFEPGLRLELEYTHHWIQGTEASFGGASFSSNASDTDDFNSYMANVYYDYDTGSGFLPYIGLGGGVTDIDADDTIFAFQAMTGVGYELTDNVTLYVGYRYFRTINDLETASTAEQSDGFQIHSAETGIRFSF